MEVLNIRTSHDLPIGTLFTVDDDKTVLRVTDYCTSWRCEICYFEKQCRYYRAHMDEVFLCSPFNRKDKKTVVFKKVCND